MAFLPNFFLALLFSCSVISLIDASKNGITVDLIHRDSPLSPFYNPNQTRFERLRNAFHRSFARKASLNPTSITAEDTIQEPLYSTGGEYLMKLSIGTPPVEILAIVDTGSDLLWTPCIPCTKCDQQNATLFDPRKSTSYRQLVCDSNLCSAVGSANCDRENNCQYLASYGDESYSNGDLATETISLQSNSGGSLSYKVAFGCGHDNHYAFEDGAAKTGIVGLGGGDLSLVNQLYKSIGGKFSYCLAQSDAPSKISFGSNALVLGPKVVSTPLIKKSRDTFYYLSLEGVTVGTNRIDYGTVYGGSTDQGNIIIDSGTTLTLFPEQFYQKLESALVEVIKAERVMDPHGDYPLCYQTNGGDFEAPKIVFHFTDADLELSSRSTFVELDSGMLCLTMVPSQDLPIFGNLNQRDYLIGYDLVNNKGLVFDRDYKTKTIQACAHGDWSRIILSLPSFNEYTWSRLRNHALRIDKCLITYRAQCPINSEGIVRVPVHDTRVDSEDSRQAEFVFPVTCNVNMVYYGSSWISNEEKQFPWRLTYKLENTNIRTGVTFCKLKGQLKLCSCPKATEIALRSPEIQIMSNNFSKAAVDVWHVGYVNLNPALNRGLTIVDRRRMSVDSVKTIPGLSYHDFSRRSLSGQSVDYNTSQNLDVKPEDNVSQVSSSRKDESLVCSGSLTGHQIVDIVKTTYDRGQNDVRQKLVNDNSKS